MAQSDSKRNFRGAVGNVVFRTLNGKQIVQSKPGPLRHTAATKLSGSEFRQCSSWAKQLRLGLTPFLTADTDSYMYRRFTGVLYKALQANTTMEKGQRSPLNANMGGLAGFEFNTHSPFATHLALPLTASLNGQRQVVVSLPDFTPRDVMLFPEGADSAELLLYAYATNLGDPPHTSDAYTVLPIARNSSTQPASLPCRKDTASWFAPGWYTTRPTHLRHQGS